MKKVFVLFLCVVMALSLFACASEEKKADKATDPTTEPNESVSESESAEDPSEPAEAKEMTFFSLNYKEDYTTSHYMMAYYEENGDIYFEYADAEKKTGHMPATIMLELAEQLVNSGLAELNGRSEYVEGEAEASIYVEYADGTSLMADFTGSVPQEFIDGYAAMLNFYKEKLVDVEAYVPEVAVSDGVDEQLQQELLAVMNSTEIPNLNDYSINPVTDAEQFFMELGLSNADNVAVAANCKAMMMTTPFALAMVRAGSADLVSAVRADYEASFDWGKWVCVRPTRALIATKGDLVACLMADDNLFDMVKAAIEANGWTDIAVFDAPQE